MLAELILKKIEAQSFAKEDLNKVMQLLRFEITKEELEDPFYSEILSNQQGLIFNAENSHLEVTRDLYREFCVVQAILMDEGVIEETYVTLNKNRDILYIKFISNGEFEIIGIGGVELVGSPDEELIMFIIETLKMNTIKFFMKELIDANINLDIFKLIESVSKKSAERRLSLTKVRVGEDNKKTYQGKTEDMFLKIDKSLNLVMIDKVSLIEDI